MQIYWKRKKMVTRYTTDDLETFSNNPDEE